MEGNRPIRLYPLRITDTAAGDTVRDYPEDLAFDAYATRRDGGGAIVPDAADQRAADARTAFTIRRPIMPSMLPRADWRLVDETGEQWLIQSVNEIPGTRGGKLALRCLSSADVARLGIG